jgi:hypothetical protein
MATEHWFHYKEELKMKAVRCLLVLIFLSPWSAGAFEVPDVSVHGFISQGYLKSNDNNFLTSDSMDGTAQFTEAGVVLSSQVSDSLRVGMQFLSRDLGDVGNGEVKLDWGFADYSHNDYLGLRVGKVKLPLGLYNEGRDTDLLRPMVFLPQSIYDETKRDLLVAYQGAGLYGSLPAGPLGYFDYHAFGGGINIDDDSLLNTALKQNGTFTTRTTLAPVLIPSFIANFGAAIPGATPAEKQAYLQANYIQQINVTSLEINNEYIAGGSLVLNTALDGLRLGGSVLTVKNDTEYVLNRSVNPAINPMDPNQVFVPTRLTGTIDNKLTWVASLEYVLGDFCLSSEYSETEREQTFNGTVATNATSQSGYVMGAYTLFDSLTLSLLYDVYYSDKDDRNGKEFAATSPDRQDFFAWRKDFGVGARYDINPNWLIKAEYHTVDGAALFMTTVNDPSQLKSDWDYFAVKMSYNF